METKEKITFTQEVKKIYRISEKDKKQFYTIMALFEFNNGCSTEYDEQTVLANLCYFLEAINREVNRQIQLTPNNFYLNKCSGFLSKHYGNLKKIVGDLAENPVSQ